MKSLVGPFWSHVVSGGNSAPAHTDLVLFLPMTLQFEVGDTLTLIAGCNRTIKVCRDRFANAQRNRSYYMLSGRRKLLDFPKGTQS